MKAFCIAMILVAIAGLAAYGDGWQALTPNGDAPSARYGHSLVNIDGVCYLFGGQGPSQADGKAEQLFDDTYKYDPASNTFTKIQTEGDKPPAMAKHASLVYKGQKFVIGGLREDSANIAAYAFNPNDSKWTKKSPAPFPNRANAGAAVVGSTAYVVGGTDGGQVSSSLWKYDLENDTWQEGMGMPQGAVYGHSMFACENELFLYGGSTAVGGTDTMWRYNIANSYWVKYTTIGRPPSRVYHVTSQAGGKIWVTGGYGTSSAGRAAGRELNDIWELDMPTKTWIAKSPGPAHQQAAGFVYPLGNGDVGVFVFGGLKENQVLNTLWQYYSGEEPPNPPQSPRLFHCRVVEGKLTFDISPTESNAAYTVESTTRLNDEGFSPAGSLIGNGATMTYTDSEAITNAPMRFFRVAK